MKYAIGLIGVLVASVYPIDAEAGEKFIAAEAVVEAEPVRRVRLIDLPTDVRYRIAKYARARRRSEEEAIEELLEMALAD